MLQLELTTPSLLFSAISLILLAYTNRFLSYASTVRNLKDKHDSDPEAETSSVAQINNLYKRLQLIRYMQILGAGSLLFCLTSMFFMYIDWHYLAAWIFGIGMILLALSLCLCIWEIQISVHALGISLGSLRRQYRGQGLRHTLTRKEPSEPQATKEAPAQHPRRRRSRPQPSNNGGGGSEDTTPERRPQNSRRKPRQSESAAKAGPLPEPKAGQA